MLFVGPLCVRLCLDRFSEGKGRSIGEVVARAGAGEAEPAGTDPSNGPGSGASGVVGDGHGRHVGLGHRSETGRRRCGHHWRGMPEAPRRMPSN